MPIKSRLTEDETGPKDEENHIIGSQNKIIWKHNIDDTVKRLSNAATSRIEYTFTDGSRSAANIQNVRTLLTTEQLKDCAEAYTNCGFLRSVIDKNIYFMTGERTKFQIVPNDELTQNKEDKEIREIEKNIKNNTKYQELARDLIRLNKRVELHDRLIKLLTNVWVFGRGFLQVERLKVDDPESKVSTKEGKERN